MQEYYIIRDGERFGPFNADQLPYEGLTPDSLVWRPGLTDWQAASTLPELSHLLSSPAEPEESAFGTYAEMPPEPTFAHPATQYYAMIGNTRIGPMAADQLSAYGVRPDTPVWSKDMVDWQPASTRPDVMMHLTGTAPGQAPSNPYYNSDGTPRHDRPASNGIKDTNPNYAYNRNNYGPNQPGYGYGNQQVNNFGPRHYNWMTWAIIGTIAGGLFSCIGLIFGAIAISKASSANRAYEMGDDAAGDSYNASAKTMTIISLILAGVGILLNIWIVSSGMSIASLYSR